MAVLESAHDVSVTMPPHETPSDAMKVLYHYVHQHPKRGYRLVYGDGRIVNARYQTVRMKPDEKTSVPDISFVFFDWENDRTVEVDRHHMPGRISQNGRVVIDLGQPDTFPSYRLLPKHGRDYAAVEQLTGLSDDELAPLWPRLLQWFRYEDCPIVQNMLVLLSAHQTEVETHLVAVLAPAQSDTAWKRRVIETLLPALEDTIGLTLMEALSRLAESPTPEEASVSLDRVAWKWLDDTA